ncbi:MAG: discoidin domain-containing protein [Planctomycetes bacterium]|nr:discoidin domain-containing protein [Planctomycetota bacterium]
MSKKLIYLVSFVLVLALVGTNVVFGDTVWEGRVEDDLDDVEEQSSGSVDTTSSDLELPDDQVIGIRFVKVYVPQGATVSKAYLEFTVDELEGPQATNMIIDGELSPNARAFADATNNVSNRARTTEKVGWQPEDWPVIGETHQSPDISFIIEEIVNQDGWVSGSSIVIIIYDDPDNPSISFRTAEAGPGDDAVLLHIEWSLGKAKRPNPADGETEVSRDAVLSWQPGFFAPPVNGHRIYLSKNFDDVNDGVGGITQSADSYAPGRLDYGTTYYWRVDEVNAPPDSTVHEGNVWSFTTEYLAYPIENITVTASSTGQQDMGPENTINGSGLDDNDLHSMDAMDMWLSGDESLGAWIEYEFDKVYKPHEMLIWNSNQMVESLIGFGFKDVTVEYSLDGTDYTALGTTHEFARAPGVSDYAHNTTVEFDDVGAKYVKLTANSNWEGLLNIFGLSEVRFLYIPVGAQNPYPASGAAGVDLDVVLSWRAGREAVTHDVYLSDDQQAVIDGTAPVETVTETSYDPLSLDLGKTYYWKINEVNESETITTWESELWNFTTVNFLIVDDFESYNDLDPADPASNRIFNAWIDGFGDPTNGSVVGYANPPFAEQSTVHSGNQSIPFEYDNAAGKSEATLTLTSNNDWTVKGVSTLTIWYQGDAANAAETIYVILNGSATVDNNDPAATQAGIWTEWNIDLTRFADQGVNLSNVTSITLGLRSVTGGAGMIYFDDIRLYPPAP